MTEVPNLLCSGLKPSSLTKIRSWLRRAVSQSSKSYKPISMPTGEGTKLLEEVLLKISEGFVLLGEHYDVHRYHPPLVYGRRGNA